MGLTRLPGQYFRVVREIGTEWQNINRQQRNQAIRSLYRSKLISAVENENGFVTMVINDAGKKKVLSYELDKMTIKQPRHWDGFWRMVVFDIPEKHKQAREALRNKLKELGFYQYQRSVFVHPYECQGEIDFVIEAFEVRPYVRYIVAKQLDNNLHLRNIFGLV